MDWIDKLNKELEERRNYNKSPKGREEAKEREKSWISCEGGKIGGKIGGKTNVESGHMERIQKIGCSLGGKKSGPIQGKKNVESGHIYDIQSVAGTKAQKVVRTCPHCGLSQKGSLYFRNHGDRCKLKGFVPKIFIEKVNEGRSKLSLAKEYGISKTYVTSLIDKFCK